MESEGEPKVCAKEGSDCGGWVAMPLRGLDIGCVLGVAAVVDSADRAWRRRGGRGWDDDDLYPRGIGDAICLRRASTNTRDAAWSRRRLAVENKATHRREIGKEKRHTDGDEDEEGTEETTATDESEPSMRMRSIIQSSGSHSPSWPVPSRRMNPSALPGNRVSVRQVPTRHTTIRPQHIQHTAIDSTHSTITHRQSSIIPHAGLQRPPLPCYRVLTPTPTPPPPPQWLQPPRPLPALLPAHPAGNQPLTSEGSFPHPTWHPAPAPRTLARIPHQPSARRSHQPCAVSCRCCCCMSPCTHPG